MAALIHERVQERADLKAEALKLLEVKERPPDQEARLIAMEARLIALDTDIARLAKLQTEEVAQSTLAGNRLELGEDRTTQRPFATFGDQLQAIHRAHTRGIIDPRLYGAAQGAGSATDADGGFLIQMDFVQGVERRMFDMSPILPRCRQLPVGANANGVSLKVIDETSRATGSRWGGVQGYWVDEGTAPTATKPKFAKVELRLHKLAALGYATDELLADAVAMSGYFEQAFAEELVFLTEDAIFNGTGAGQPLGITVAANAAKVEVSKETNQAATTIKYENLIKMWARLHPRSRGAAIWFVNVDCEPELDRLAMAVGTGALEPRFVNYGQDGLLRAKGRPVVAAEYCATLGTAGDIILVDLSQYGLITKGGVQQATSMHVAFTTDEMAFRATYRVDGRPLWRSAITPFKGTNSLSPYITLATRS